MSGSHLKSALVGGIAGAVFATATIAFAGSGVGGVFNLGQQNTVNGQSSLAGNTANPQLRVQNSNGTDTGTGVLGLHSASSGIAPAVQGDTASNAGNAAAVVGRVTSSNAAVTSAAVKGVNAGKGKGVFGQTTGYSGIGVRGVANNGSQAKGVEGETVSGYAGFFNATGSVGWGVFGTGGQYGAYFTSGKTGAYAAGTDTGVKGQSTAPDAVGVHGLGATGVLGETSMAGGTNAGVRGVATNSDALAGRFDGRTLFLGTVQIQGDVYVSSGYVDVSAGVLGPAAGACDESVEEGRIVAHDGTLYVCNGSGWVAQR